MIGPATVLGVASLLVSGYFTAFSLTGLFLLPMQFSTKPEKIVRSRVLRYAAARAVVAGGFAGVVVLAYLLYVAYISGQMSASQGALYSDSHVMHMPAYLEIFYHPLLLIPGIAVVLAALMYFPSVRKRALAFAVLLLSSAISCFTVISAVVIFSDDRYIREQLAMIGVSLFTGMFIYFSLLAQALAKEKELQQ